MPTVTIKIIDWDKIIKSCPWRFHGSHYSSKAYCLFPRADTPVYANPLEYKSNDAMWYYGLTEEEKKAHKAKIEKELGLPEGSLASAEPF